MTNTSGPLLGARARAALGLLLRALVAAVALSALSALQVGAVSGRGAARGAARGRAGVTSGQRVQLHRALSKLGLCSRKLAWHVIKEGRVSVNGHAARDPLMWVDIGSDAMSLDGVSQRRTDAGGRVWMVHKPCGMLVSRTDDRAGRPGRGAPRATVYSLFPAISKEIQGLAEGRLARQMQPRNLTLAPDAQWRFPVGRLDFESEGLLLMTTDGQLGHALTEPGEHYDKKGGVNTSWSAARGVAKTYHVWVYPAPSADVLVSLASGILLGGEMTRPAAFRELSVEPGDGGQAHQGENMELETMACRARSGACPFLKEGREGKGRGRRAQLEVVTHECPPSVACTCRIRTDRM